MQTALGSRRFNKLQASGSSEARLKAQHWSWLAASHLHRPAILIGHRLTVAYRVILSLWVKAPRTRRSYTPVRSGAVLVPSRRREGRATRL
jgi:hypothetical protein